MPPPVSTARMDGLWFQPPGAAQVWPGTWVGPFWFENRLCHVPTWDQLFLTQNRRSCLAVAAADVEGQKKKKPTFDFGTSSLVSSQEEQDRAWKTTQSRHAIEGSSSQHTDWLGLLT